MNRLKRSRTSTDWGMIHFPGILRSGDDVEIASRTQAELPTRLPGVSAKSRPAKAASELETPRKTDEKAARNAALAFEQQAVVNLSRARRLPDAGPQSARLLG